MQAVSVGVAGRFQGPAAEGLVAAELSGWGVREGAGRKGCPMYLQDGVRTGVTSRPSGVK